MMNHDPPIILQFMPVSLFLELKLLLSIAFFSSPKVDKDKLLLLYHYFTFPLAVG
jgi:hypothetical protein